MEIGFYHLHGFFGQPDPRLIGLRDQRHRRMLSFPGHGLSKVDDSIDGIKQGPIPVVFQNTPAAFNCIVFTMVGRVIV